MARYVVRGNKRSWAVFSPDYKYRYILGRTWSGLKPLLVVAMLNPSYADHNIGDHTLTRVLSFARKDGFGRIVIVNACALITPNPKVMAAATDPVGGWNKEAVRTAIDCVAGDDRVVVAWGNPPSRGVEEHTRRLQSALLERVPEIWRWGSRTKLGNPRHPLRMRADTPLVLHARVATEQRC